MDNFQLQKSIQVIFFNLNKREVEDQRLEAGTLIEYLEEGTDPLGNTTWYFMASINGEIWYHYRSYEKPE